MRVWIDGELRDETSAQVSVYDHGLVTGDGVFETVKVVDGRAFALTRHIERLRRSARGLGLREPDGEGVQTGVDELLTANPDLRSARLRITYTGGLSSLRSDREQVPPTLVLALAPPSPVGSTCDVIVVPWARNERGALAGLKTTSYAENVLALAYAKERGAEEAIFANTVGNLCEGTGTNVFVVRDGRLTTPPLSAGCLAGVTRALVLEWVGGQEQDLPIGAFAEAEEAFLTSTGRDIQPIRAVDGRELPAAPGPQTKRAMDIFARRSSADLDP